MVGPYMGLVRVAVNVHQECVPALCVAPRALGLEVSPEIVAAAQVHSLSLKYIAFVMTQEADRFVLGASCADRQPVGPGRGQEAAAGARGVHRAAPGAGEVKVKGRGQKS